MKHEVTLTIELIEGGLTCDQLIEQLGEADFTDVLVGCGRLPIVALSFPDSEPADALLRLRTLLGSTVLFPPEGIAFHG
jgi:hypothetical protein